MNDDVNEYKIEVTRDGRWWMIHIPDVGGLTQARPTRRGRLHGA